MLALLENVRAIELPPKMLWCLDPLALAEHVQRVSHTSSCLLGSDASNIYLDACSCEKAPDGGILPTETDFTTKAAAA